MTQLFTKPECYLTQFTFSDLFTTPQVVYKIFDTTTPCTKRDIKKPLHFHKSHFYSHFNVKIIYVTRLSIKSKMNF